MEKIVLVDCDGVVAGFVDHTIKVLDLPIEKKDVHTFYLQNLPGMEGYDEKLRSLWATPEFWMSLPVLHGAQEGIENFRNKGFEIVWVTSPYMGCPHWYWARLEWLKEHFPACADRKNLIAAHKKEIVRGSILIDDKPKNVKRWQASHPNGSSYLMDQPWNREFDWKRVDWPLLMEMY